VGGRVWSVCVYVYVCLCVCVCFARAPHHTTTFSCALYLCFTFMPVLTLFFCLPCAFFFLLASGSSIISFFIFPPPPPPPPPPILPPPPPVRRVCPRARREKAHADKDNYYKKRQLDKKAHMKRTSKGQPVTKTLISNILAKLQKE
jgi:hypothetical protein